MLSDPSQIGEDDTNDQKRFEAFAENDNECLQHTRPDSYDLMKTILIFKDGGA